MPPEAVTIIEPLIPALHKGGVKVAEPVTLGFAFIVVVAVVEHKFDPDTVMVYVPEESV
jgi:hypothetical protein